VGLGAAAFAAPAVLDGVWTAFRPPEVSTVQVRLPNLPRALSGMSFVQLTDIHVGPWVDARFLQEIIDRSQALRPDFFAITGDLMDGDVAQLGPTVGLLGKLQSRFGTFFVTGNHEYYSGVEQWVPALRGMGMTVLRNQRVSLGDSSASLDLVGVDDWGAHRQGFASGYDLQAALAGAEPGRARILLAHQPKGFEEAVQGGVGLQVSGHTHGGQLWPWRYLVPLVYPYFSGRYTLGESTIYVSRGCGFWGPPVRLGVPAEIVRVVLV
jgi:predicted MPP superfamily phosphohydrolase